MQQGPVTAGASKLAHGLREEDEQLLQAGLAQELHVGVTKGESVGTLREDGHGG